MKRPGNTALSRLKKPVAGVGGVTYLHVRFKIPAGISKLYHDVISYYHKGLSQRIVDKTNN